jgi:hypothetical protein
MFHHHKTHAGTDAIKVCAKLSAWRIATFVVKKMVKLPAQKSALKDAKTSAVIATIADSNQQT